MLATRAADNVVIVAFNNLVGGQDELIFDGNGMIFSQNGELIIQGKQFEEDLIIADLDIDAVFRRRLHDPRHRIRDRGDQLWPGRLHAGSARGHSLARESAENGVRQRRSFGAP